MKLNLFLGCRRHCPLFLVQFMLLMVLVGLSAPTLAAERTAPPPVSIPYTHQFDMPSRHVGDRFRIMVGLPPTYSPSRAKSYPVLYVLDANAFFGTALETVRVALPSGQIPEVIVVGIGYPVEDFKQTWGLRMRDYAPVADREHFYSKMVERALPGQPASIYDGGASKFLSFIREELMPEIGRRYHADPKDAAIFGDSLGGTFALYTLLASPTTFQRYAIGSPAVSWGNNYLVEMARKQPIQEANAPVKVYLSVGADEGSGVSEVLNFAALLRERNGAGRDAKLQIFEGENHISVIPLNIARGLRGIYCSPPRTTGCGSEDGPLVSQ